MKNETSIIPAESQQPDNELAEIMEMVSQHFQPCAEGAANAYKSTEDFIAQTGLPIVNKQEMETILKKYGYHKVFVPKNGMLWCVYINED